MERDDAKSHNQYNHHLKSKKPIRGNKKQPIKVKYISSPMMVKACNPAEFRAIVHQLTGQQSQLGGTTTSPEEEQAGTVTTTTTTSNEIPISNEDQAYESYDQRSLMSSPVEINELASLWRDLVSETDSIFGFQYPCVLV